MAVLAKRSSLRRIVIFWKNLQLKRSIRDNTRGDFFWGRSGSSEFTRCGKKATVFLELNVRAFSTGCAAIICHVIKKYKIQVYYMNVTNLTVQNGCVMIAVNGGSTYAKEPEKP